MNHVRILEEAEFSKRQKAEHTVVIREVVSNLEKEYEEKLKEYHIIRESEYYIGIAGAYLNLVSYR